MLKRLLIAFCLLTVFGCTSDSSDDGGAPPNSIIHFCQTDALWVNDTMGTSGDTIGSNGALLVSMTMLISNQDASVDPALLNTHLTNNGGYSGSTSMIYWNGIESYSGTSFAYTGSAALDPAMLKSEIDSGMPVIARVNSGSHFVLVWDYDNDGTNLTDFIYYDPADSTGTLQYMSAGLNADNMYMYD